MWLIDYDGIEIDKENVLNDTTPKNILTGRKGTNTTYEPIRSVVLIMMIVEILACVVYFLVCVMFFLVIVLFSGLRKDGKVQLFS